MDVFGCFCCWSILFLPICAGQKQLFQRHYRSAGNCTLVCGRASTHDRCSLGGCDLYVRVSGLGVCGTWDDTGADQLCDCAGHYRGKKEQQEHRYGLRGLTRRALQNFHRNDRKVIIFPLYVDIN